MCTRVCVCVCVCVCGVVLSEDAHGSSCYLLSFFLSFFLSLSCFLSLAFRSVCVPRGSPLCAIVVSFASSSSARMIHRRRSQLLLLSRTRTHHCSFGRFFFVLFLFLYACVLSLSALLLRASSGFIDD
ncbi:MAG: hypothetical protein ACK41O_27230 [Runella zeae]